MRAKDRGESFELKVSETSDFVPESTYVEAVVTFMEIATILLNLICSWTYTKENPPSKS